MRQYDLGTYWFAAQADADPDTYSDDDTGWQLHANCRRHADTYSKYGSISDRNYRTDSESNAGSDACARPIPR